MMEYLIYNKGFDLIKRDDKFFIIYEYGDGACYMREREATEAEVLEILADNDKAGSIIQKYQNCLASSFV